MLKKNNIKLVTKKIKQAQKSFNKKRKIKKNEVRWEKREVRWLQPFVDLFGEALNGKVVDFNKINPNELQEKLKDETFTKLFGEKGILNLLEYYGTHSTKSGIKVSYLKNFIMSGVSARIKALFNTGIDFNELKRLYNIDIWYLSVDEHWVDDKTINLPNGNQLKIIWNYKLGSHLEEIKINAN